MRIAPPANRQSHTSNTSKHSATPHLTNGAPSAPGVPDTLRASISPAAQQPSGLEAASSTHPLEARLIQWRQTQDAMKMESLRRVYGIAEPVRRGMEMKIVREGQWKPAVLGGTTGGSIHEDILALGGRETEVAWEDVFHSMFLLPLLVHTTAYWALFGYILTDALSTLGDELREPPSFHDEMEQRVNMHR